METSNSIVLYNGLTFTFPEKPKKIQGQNLPKHKQKWQRISLPDNFEELYGRLDVLDKKTEKLNNEYEKIQDSIYLLENKKTKSADKIEALKQSLEDIIILINANTSECEVIEKEIEKFAFEEDRKCTEGIWFMNNGVPTYITGDNYFYLQWFMLDGFYPEYRDVDRRWFYHWKICEDDVRCDGQMYGKKRRDGYSFRVCSIILNKARKTFDARFGIISKTGVDAKGMFDKFINAFKNLPKFFKPQIATAEDINNNMWFKTPQQKISFKNRETKKEVSLNTLTSWANASNNAFDSTKQFILAADEFGKWEEADGEVWLNVGKRCILYANKNKSGKLFVGSTVNELKKGGQAFKSVWEISDYSIRNKNDRTISGLYRYFVPAYDGLSSLDGTIQFIDEYGNSVIDTPAEPIMGIDGQWIKKGAKEYVLDELEALKNAGKMVAYYELKRQFPFTESDMFINPSAEFPEFDIDKIYQQIEYNKNTVVENILHYGYFQWVGGVRDGIVEWIETGRQSPMWKFCVYWFPPESERNRWTQGRDGLKYPANTHKGLITLDPYSGLKPKDEKRASKAASHGIKKFDVMHTIKHKHFIFEYWNRLNDPLHVYEDMIMASTYYGWGLMPEKNVKGCNDYFRNRDLHKYLLPSPSMTQDEFIENLGKEDEGGVANSSPKVRQQFVDYLASWIANYCGYNEKTGEMGFMPFNNTLEDWLKFDIKKWTPYDLTVSSMIGMLGADAILQKPQKEIPQYDFFKRYPIRR